MWGRECGDAAAGFVYMVSVEESNRIIHRKKFAQRNSLSLSARFWMYQREQSVYRQHVYILVMLCFSCGRTTVLTYFCEIQ